MDDLLTSEGQKLHPQIMLMLPFSEHASHEEACYSNTRAQTTDYLTFFLPLITSLCTSNHPILFTHKYPEPLAFREEDLRLVLLSPHLVALQINPFSAANLGISAFGLLRVGQTNQGP